MLAMFVDESHDDWDDHLPYLTMAYRACIHESTKCSPNLLMLGREISLPIDILTGSPDPNPTVCPIQYIEWMRDSMQRAFDVANEKLQSSFKRQKKYYDCKLKTRQYEIGQKVLRWYPPKANQKLGLGWTGPYIIMRKLSDITYEIQDCGNSKFKVVHVDHLKPLIERGDLLNCPRNEDVDSNETVRQLATDYDDIDENELIEYTPENQQNNVSPPLSPKYSRRGRLIKPPVKFSP